MAFSLNQEQIEALSSIAGRLAASGMEDESLKLRELLAAIEQPSHELSAPAAARILQVTPQTVRNWVRAGLLQGRRDRTGHFHVDLDALSTAIDMRQALRSEPPPRLSDEEIEMEIEAVRTQRGSAARDR